MRGKSPGVITDKARGGGESTGQRGNQLGNRQFTRMVRGKQVGGLRQIQGTNVSRKLLFRAAYHTHRYIKKETIFPSQVDQKTYSWNLFALNKARGVDGGEGDGGRYFFTTVLSSKFSCESTSAEMNQNRPSTERTTGSSEGRD